MKRRLSNSSNNSEHSDNNKRRKKTSDMDSSKYDIKSVILVQKYARRYLSQREMIRNVFKDAWNHLDYHEGKIGINLKFEFWWSGRTAVIMRPWLANSLANFCGIYFDFFRILTSIRIQNYF